MPLNFPLAPASESGRYIQHHYSVQGTLITQTIDTTVKQIRRETVLGPVNKASVKVSRGLPQRTGMRPTSSHWDSDVEM